MFMFSHLKLLDTIFACTSFCIVLYFDLFLRTDGYSRVYYNIYIYVCIFILDNKILFSRIYIRIQF